ncbi:MAG: hypothetical protein ACD_79C00090G0003 [uncultured bacterium]|nr:MAG: hypothetical protein ACD_79C00090G0003 [uncultured bacterium]
MINIYCIRPKGFNIGNDVIYLGVQHFIRNAFQEGINIISIPATGKYESQKKAGITSQTVYEINQFGHGLLIGGGNLYENGELEINPTALNALEKPQMIFSVSRGKIYNSNLEFVDRTDVMTDEKIILLNKKAIVSLSRDLATKKYLDLLNCNNCLSGCPTLFINEMPQHYVPVSAKTKTDVLISIRTPTLMSIPVTYQYELREQIVAIISMLRDFNYKNIKFLCHDHRDIPFAASFKNVEYLYTEDVFTYLTFLRNSRLNLTFRLHSFLPCISYGIPAIKISYDERAISMLDTIGLKDWNINLLKQDLLNEVKIRIQNIHDLDIYREKLMQTTWLQLKTNIIKGFERFKEKVYEQR